MLVRPAVLFVCLGNICRSPLAEAAFRLAAGKAGLDAEADSAGTARWHLGEPPDRRAQDVARRYGIDIGFHRGRQVEEADFTRFSHVVALDGHNLTMLRMMRPAHGSAEIGLLLDYAPGRAGQDVADPYYGDKADFQTTWRDVSAGAQGLVRLLTL